MKTCRPGRAPAGVTLVEILIAVVVLALGLSTILQIFPLSATASARSRHKIIMMELAQEQLDQIRTNCQQYYADPASVTLTYPVASPTAWVAFTAPNDKYWFRVRTAPVRPLDIADPANPLKQWGWGDPPADTRTETIFTELSCIRYTVDVVGPVSNSGAADTEFARNNGITLATFSTNRNLGQLTLVNTGFPSNVIDAGLVQAQGPTGVGYLFQMNSGDTHPLAFTCFSGRALDQLPFGITQATIGSPTGWPLPAGNGLLDIYRFFASNVILQDANGDVGIYKIDGWTPGPVSNQFYIHFYDPPPGHDQTSGKNVGYAPFPEYSSRGLTTGEYLPEPPTIPNCYRSYLDPVNSLANPAASLFTPVETHGTGGNHAKFTAGATLRSFIVIGTQP